MCMSPCSLQINIQIHFQLVKVCTFSIHLFAGGDMSPVANLVSLEVDVEVALGVFFACMDDAVVMDDAVTNDAVTAIVCAANPTESE